MDVRLSLPVFSAIGFYLLWVLMLQNGTLDALDAVTSTGVFPNGRPLTTTYLGIPAIDSAISTLVAFTDALSNGSEGSPRLLMIEVVSTLQSASLWAIVESLRRGSGPLGLVFASFWPLMWNGFGAGVVLPLFYFFESAKLPPKRSKNDRVSVAHAKALLPTAVFTLFLPVLVDLAPPFVNREPRLHNIITALFQATGLYAAIVQPLIASQFGGSSTPRATTEKAVRRAYFYAGIFSSIGHIYAVSASILSNDPAVSLSRTFVPAMSDVVPGTSRTVFEGTLLFLKYDNVIITITSALWQWLSLKPYLNMKSRIDYVSTAVLITLSTLVLGPGGSVSFAHYLRESWIR